MQALPAPLHVEHLKSLLALAVQEDIGNGDVTTLATIDAKTEMRCKVVTREGCVVAGLPVVEFFLNEYAPAIDIIDHVSEGDRVAAGTSLVELSGSVQSILTHERIVLNLLQRLSGIATLTAQFVEKVAGIKVDILDTRKTTPGWRGLEKYAVKMGGGKNHRMGLYDAFLIKDNHIAASGSLTKAIENARTFRSDLKLQVECDTLAQVREAVSAKADSILLDNMDVTTLKNIVTERTTWSYKPYLEASGGVNIITLRAIAETGVDGISIGALTHSAPNIDIGLDV